MASEQKNQAGPVNPGWFAVAVQILLLIERSEGSKACSSGELAGQLHSHAVFLRRIAAHLARAGIVEAHEGREGGYRLARPAAQITLADVYRALRSSGSSAAIPFDLPRGLALEGGLSAAFDEIGAEIETSMLSTLERYTLADLMARTQNREAGALRA